MRKGASSRCGAAAMIAILYAISARTTISMATGKALIQAMASVAFTTRRVSRGTGARSSSVLC